MGDGSDTGEGPLGTDGVETHNSKKQGVPHRVCDGGGPSKGPEEETGRD